MAILSIGYDGTVDERQWTKLQAASASVYGVATPDSWKVSAVAGSDRTISIAPGKGWGHHVFDESDTNYTRQGATVASGSRWDLVVLRRDWGAIGGGPSSFALITGGTAKALPLRANEPGVLDEQPLALVQFTAGQTQPTTIIDLRCWAANGGLEIVDKLALEYLGAPGATAHLGTDIWRFRPMGNGIWGWTDKASETAKVPLALTYLYTPDPPRADKLTQEAPSAYREGRRVHLSGVVSNSATVEFAGGIEYSLALLPAGLRPAKAEYFTIEAAFTLCRVWVRPDGHVYFMFPVKVGPLAPRNWRFSLSGISFAAA